MHEQYLYSIVHSCMETRRMKRRKRSCVAFGSLLPARGRLHFCQQAKVIQSSLAVVVAEPSHDLKRAACYRHESNTEEESEAELLDSNKMLSAVARRSRAEGVGINRLVCCASRGRLGQVFLLDAFSTLPLPF
ncbi:hypothetical protein L1887_58624 [Cichorium endivia]|nr:hypothetical protein L1887_58624 [Cichorium endivia]